MKNLVILFLLSSSFFASAHPGISIVQNSKGVIYYTDLVHVWKIDPSGSHTIAVKDVHTHELFLDEEDNLYGEHSWYEGEATDKWGYLIWRLRTNGQLENIVPPTEGFPDNNQLVRDASHNQYWAKKIVNHEVLMQTSISGEDTQFIQHKFKDIRWICAPKDKDFLLVVDHLILKQVNSDGTIKTLSSNLKEGGSIFNKVRDMHYLMGAWTDTKQNVYVAVYGDRKIKKITNDGKVTTVLKSPRGWSPSGGFFDDENSLWVLEYSNRNKARVRKICESGETEIYQQS
ncbi:MAG: hypothetical protein P1U56_18710 [Saprospiraceae bacterium]|nr:hypothetical protein [Saprospiraceae bacterium]